MTPDDPSTPMMLLSFREGPPAEWLVLCIFGSTEILDLTQIK